MLGKNFKSRLLSGDISTKEENVFVFFISLLCMIVYLASDVYLPSLPQMGKDFGTQFSQVQLTITVYMIGLACSQILHGILGDHFGKRKMLMITIPIFLIVTLAILFSPNIEVMIILRFFQAFSGSACMVIGRTIFSDVFEQKRAHRAFAVLIPAVSLSPALGPIIGGWLGHYYHWKGSFLFTFAFALIVLAYLYFFLPETKKQNQQKSPVKIKLIFKSIFQMITDMVFVENAIMIFFATAAWWVYVCGAPYMFHRANFNQLEIGFMYLPALVPYILFSFIAREKLNTKTASDIARIGFRNAVLASCIFPVLELFHFMNLETMLGGFLLITASNGFVVPMSIAMGISRFPEKTGLASGLMGTIQLLAGAMSSLIVGVIARKLDYNYFGWLVFIILMIGGVLYLFLQKKNKFYK